ncbi:beta-1,4-mannosyltransferase [Capsaspora owczarzaki ATCC 30864]|uniref:Asparagine-linked glycosylation protein 1 homolog n=1 Tax=Capsaspora owczarzaki (strain ATCC 30864) TaxID=595528 RepID=A0A0D2UPD9_CAPO3|nr:beta-1,4-mannosyltransferase [Capsaspora owczarzaki ATCC 30864]
MSVPVLLLQVAVLLLALLGVVVVVQRLQSRTAKRVCIVVLGDFGRSPRMQYHAMSLAALGLEVDVLAYSGSRPHDEIRSNPRIHLVALREAPRIAPGLPKPFYLVYGVAKAAFLAAQLVLRLMAMRPYRWCLIQNPPTIPTFALAWAICRLRNAKLVIDWHNYGYTILGLAHGAESRVVRLAKWFEFTFGRWGDAHFCVTEAMRRDLRLWGIDARTLYDRPPPMFQETSVEDSHQLFCKLDRENPGLFTLPFANQQPVRQTRSKTAAESTNASPDTPTRTLVTVANPSGQIELVAQRPALLVSSTSWTEDEDFSMLLQALEAYEEKAKVEENALPNIICLITGKGPMKAFYEAQIAAKQWLCVRIRTLWLEAADYPRLLGACNLGVCLHKSSSGLDLPMKVVDMFGCGLPVCAVGFQCLHELVEHRKNGLVFRTSAELCEQLQSLLYGFPSQDFKLREMRKHLQRQRIEEGRWAENWTAIAAPVFI